MSVSLTKGGNTSLSKIAPGLTRVLVDLGWEPRVTNGAPFDLDASALMLGDDDRILSDRHFIFFNKLSSDDGSVEHTGDDRTGDGDGESVKVDLAAVPAACARIVFAVSIYDADRHRQNFGQVGNAYVRVINAMDGVELVRFDLSEDASTETAMVFGEIYRRGGEWKFRAVAQGYPDGLRGIARHFGVDVRHEPDPGA
ncbi:TerD family protein [Microtetraspora niveoalba]|uniref:TerD family protein n=1 Tax=Microtetraspora niveoalba TaxID=46175 RepID=UPI000829BCEE|nr:TerD family protein [Microtetraspora niveoalba]